MLFRKTSLQDVHLIDLEKRGDDRGFFARLFCQDEFKQNGLVQDYKQINTSLSAKRGTLRGMHYQLVPSSEVKIVRCIRGALWDAVIDLRPDSSTYKNWFGAELSAENRTMMYVPRGFAHGFITLTDDVEALYLVSDPYSPILERGIRWNDPEFGIGWPLSPTEISNKDVAWPDFDPQGFHATEALRGAR